MLTVTRVVGLLVCSVEGDQGRVMQYNASTLTLLSPGTIPASPTVSWLYLPAQSVRVRISDTIRSLRTVIVWGSSDLHWHWEYIYYLPPHVQIDRK